MISITAPVTKWNCQIRKADQIADTVMKALKIAVSDRPGPVLLDITKDAQTDKAEYTPSLTPIDYSCTVTTKTTAIDHKPKNVLYEEIIKTLRESGKKIVLAVDKVPNDFYSDEYFCSNKVLKSGIFGVPGFGLPAAIGASHATTDKTICLVASGLEFQATIKELGVILQQALDIKIILLTNSPDNRFGVKNPDLIQFASAYGIKGGRVEKKENLSGDIQKMLNSTGSYLLEVRDDLFENS